jgi:hypothetical protein
MLAPLGCHQQQNYVVFVFLGGEPCDLGRLHCGLVRQVLLHEGHCCVELGASRQAYRGRRNAKRGQQCIGRPLPTEQLGGCLLYLPLDAAADLGWCFRLWRV